MSTFATWADWVASSESDQGGDTAMPMLPALAADMPICARTGLNDARLADLDRRAPGLFQVARQVVA